MNDQEDAAMGLKNVDNGDQQKAVDLMVKYVNSHGGLGGRKINPIVYVNSSTSESPWCPEFAQDNKVFAVVTPFTAETLLDCLAPVGTVLLQEDSSVHDEQDFKKYVPFYYAPAWLNQTQDAIVQVEGLLAMGFFTKGAKIAIMRYDNPSYARAAALIKSLLAQKGLKVSDEFAARGIDDPSAFSNAAVKFNTEGISHIIVLDYHAQMMWLFTPAAESQHYRPHYGLTSAAIWDFSKSNDPSAQLQNAVGVGHRPVDDVNSRDHNAAIKKCLDIFANGGLQLASSNAVRYNVGICDLVMFLKAGLDHASAPNAKALAGAVAAFGDSFQSALTFRTHFGPGGFGGPSAIRYAAYNAGCQCLQYTTGLLPLPTSATW